MNITISKEVQTVLDGRGLKADDIKKVIENAEKNNDKIYNGKKFIAKLVIGDITVYADYCKSGDDITVNSGYSHKMKILSIVLATDDTEWKYCKNKKVVKKGHTDLTYLGATRSGPSLVEPESGESWFEEYLAAKTLAVAEGLFAQKRA
jgi:Ni,Fe-hydrogenase I large subunit